MNRAVAHAFNQKDSGTIVTVNPSAEGEDLEFRHYLRVLRRRKISVLLTVAWVVAAVLFYISRQEPSYQATAEVLLQGRPSEQIFTVGGDQSRAREGSRVQTEIAVMRSASVRDAASLALGRPAAVSITPQGDTDVVWVTAVDRDPKEAARTAQIYAQTYVSVRREQLVNDLLGAIEIVQAEVAALDAQIGATDQPLRELDGQIPATFDPVARGRLQAQRDELVRQREGPMSRREAFQEQLDQLKLSSNLIKTGGAEIVSRAAVPERPAGPKKSRWLLMAVTLGLVLGVVVAFAREHFDERLRTKDDLEHTLPALPVLAVIPAVSGWRNRRKSLLVSHARPASPAAEAYRRLRTALLFNLLSNHVRVVQVTSPNPDDGKTMTAANLGLSLSRTGRRVVLVDCNLRRPRLHTLFGLHNGVGLSSVLENDEALSSAIQPVPEEPRLTLLASGPNISNASDLLSSDRARRVLSALAEQADVVIVDAPPLLPVTDAVVLAGAVDAVLVVVRAGRTTRCSLTESLELLEQVHAPVVGAVLNGSHGRGGHLRSRRRGPYAQREQGWRLWSKTMRRASTDGSTAGADSREEQRA